VLVESDLAGTVLDEFVFFNGKRTARRTVSTGAIYYFFSDHLGSSRVVTDSAGTIVEESDYYPFGGERIIVDSLDNNYKFTSKERDAESGLDFFLARHYSYNVGRFLQPDEFQGGPVDLFSSNDPLPPGPLPYAEITSPQSLNKYAYAYNAPLRYVDPTGHCATALTLPLCGGAAVGALAGGPPGAAIGALAGLVFVATALLVATDPPSPTHFSEAEAAKVATEAKDVAQKLAGAVAAGQITGEGARSAEQASKHVEEIRQATDQLNSLRDELRNAKGKKERDKIKDAIESKAKKVEGLVKELKQKWGKALKEKLPAVKSGGKENEEEKEKRGS